MQLESSSERRHRCGLPKFLVRKFLWTFIVLCTHNDILYYIIYKIIKHYQLIFNVKKVISLDM